MASDGLPVRNATRFAMFRRLNTLKFPVDRKGSARRSESNLDASKIELSCRQDRLEPYLAIPGGMHHQAGGSLGGRGTKAENRTSLVQIPGGKSSRPGKSFGGRGQSENPAKRPDFISERALIPQWN